MRRYGKLFASVGISVALVTGSVPAVALAQVAEPSNESTNNAAVTLVQDANVANTGNVTNTGNTANDPETGTPDTQGNVEGNVEGGTQGGEGGNVEGGGAEGGTQGNAEGNIEGGTQGNVGGTEGNKEADEETKDPKIVPANDIEKFVYRLYTVVLDREPDLDGYHVQVNALNNGFGAAEIARNFLISEEFMNRELTDEQRVEIAYQTLLDRECESEESLEFWADHLKVGMSLDGIAKGFCESQEFVNNCAKWGVNRGELNVLEARDINYYVTAYAYNLYKVSLNRTPDAEGLNVQVQALLNGMPAARIAENFMISAEFTNMGKTPEEQIEAVYQSMLGRESDEAGMEFWKTRLEVGMTIGSVVAGFSQAGEFKDIAAKYQVNGETITAYMLRDMNYEVTKYVHSFYADALNREATPEDLDYWCNFLFTNGGAVDAAVSVFCGEEFTSGVGAKMTDEDFVKAVYKVLFDREADEAGLAYQVSLLENGTYENREALVNALGDSDEFTARCDLMGVRQHHKLTVEELINILDRYSVGNSLVVFNSKKQLSQARYDAIIDALNAFYYAGKEVGFTMIDLNTGIGISYNSDVSFSSACSVKGPYTIALNQYDPSSLSRYASLMYPALSVSDNGTYMSYFYAEGTWPIDQYIARGHVTSFSWTGWTAWYTAEDLARMWVCSADYLLNDTSENCEWLKSVLSSNSATMSRNAALRYGCGTVYAKSGWHETARTEGALVMAGDNPYVTGIMSTANINYSELVTDLAAAIYEAHDELVNG